ncbi:serine protease inhibitor family protein, partial [Tanacetum coccineum]
MQYPKLLDEVPQELGLDEVPQELGLDEVSEEPILDEVPQKPVLDEVPQKLVLNEVQQTQTTVNNQNHLWITLIMAAGSKGQTLDQVLSFLKDKTLDELNTRVTMLVSLMANGSSSGGPSLSSANNAWIDQSLSLKISFKQVLNNVYKATCKQVDFWNKPVEAVIEVNSWAEKQTNGLIKGVHPSDAVSSETRLILANEVLEKQLVCEYAGFKVLGLPYSQGLVLSFTCGGLIEMADEGLRVSSIHHKAFLEVNKEGTEAAAATGMVVDGLSVDVVAYH